MTTRNRNTERTNRNAHINTTQNGASVLTETSRRDDGTMSIAVATEGGRGWRSGRTTLRLSFGRGIRSMRLTGRQARTLQRALNKHYETVDSAS